ncbi:hypothetical protein [Mesorhizobium sp.]|uniref:hypothetical protein n=1 Tax=Mesorhizobium sp. TaxID=1871066 RepID=UPI0025DBC518|nr:hypothetical protein [Mesorhizobium sp.]
MTDPELNAEVLLNIGFVDVGSWQAGGDVIVYELDGSDAEANQVLLNAPNALYAFVEGDQVLYIGKTARSIRKRYVGYCRPGGGRRRISAATATSRRLSPKAPRSVSSSSRRSHTFDISISKSIWPQVSRTA